MTASEAHDGCYRHEALFYDGAEGFMRGVAPFVREAVEAGEPVLVVVSPAKAAALREALAAAADRVLFADMADVGTNPARIIPAWQRFLSAHAAPGRRMRGVGEPIWAARSPAELAECERHEALLNVAFPDPSFWLMCPYDAGALAPEVIDGARRNHPYLAGAATAGPSPAFAGPEALAAPFDRPLPEPPGDALAMVVECAVLPWIRHTVDRYAREAGMAADRVADLVLTVDELATNSVRHAGGGGDLLVWREDDAVVCEVRDAGRIDDPLAGRVEPPVTSLGGRGLWIANQLCELVQIRAYADGGAVRVHKRLR